VPCIFQRSDAGSKFVDGKLFRHFSSDKFNMYVRLLFALPGRFFSQNEKVLKLLMAIQLHRLLGNS
jgi:hypothetical protein